MPAGLINDSYDLVVGILEDAGLPVVNDPRNLTPPAVIVDPPTITPHSRSLVGLEFAVYCVAVAPGNRDAMKKALELADAIVDLPELVTTAGSFGTYTNAAGQTHPAYNLSITLEVRRT